jgi:hypothetical protein
VCEGERGDGYLKALGVHEEGASIFDQYALFSDVLWLQVSLVDVLLLLVFENCCYPCYPLTLFWGLEKADDCPKMMNSGYACRKW